MCYLNLNKLITNTEVISIIGIINSFISQFFLSSRALHFNWNLASIIWTLYQKFAGTPDGTNSCKMYTLPFVVC